MNREPRVVDLSSKKLVGMSLEMSRVVNRTAELWRRFMPQRHEVTNRSTEDYIFNEWLPSSDRYDLYNREHFEVLPPDYDARDPSAQEEIWIPVRTKGRSSTADKQRPVDPASTVP